jgi:hypothetical protein
MRMTVFSLMLALMPCLYIGQVSAYFNLFQFSSKSEPQPCTGQTIDLCVLTANAHGVSSGSCPQLGACQYTCNNGNWEVSSNSCSNYASCSAIAFGGGADACNVPAKPHGGSGGSCADLGDCSYTCNNGSWSQNSNTCYAP